MQSQSAPSLSLSTTAQELGPASTAPESPVTLHDKAKATETATGTSTATAIPTTTTSSAVHSPALQPPPSCPPSLILDPELEHEVRNFQNANFHRQVCEQLEEVLASRWRHLQWINEQPPARQSALKEYEYTPDLMTRRRRNPASTPSPTRDPTILGVGLTAVRVIQPGGGDMPIVYMDLSWWRPLSPSPPVSR